VVRALTDTSMFAARFRENAARALLLPRRFPGQRTPLWLQRRKSADLMSAAARYPKFPMILETYRECLSDVFDLAGLTQILEDLRSRRIRVHEVLSDAPSPFAQTVLFDFTASFIYDADAPLAERRAQVLSLDHAQLKELLGSADYRELLDAEAIAAITLQAAGASMRRHSRTRTTSTTCCSRSVTSAATRSPIAPSTASRRALAQALDGARRAAPYPSKCASPAWRATSPWRTRRAIATPWAPFCPWAYPRPCSSPARRP
jgi:hypothetical protein